MNCTLSMACRITIWSHRMANRHVISNLTNRHPMRTFAHHNYVLTSLKLHLYFLIWRQYYKSCKYLIKLEYLRGSKRSDWWLRTGPYIYKGLSSHSLQGNSFDCYRNNPRKSGKIWNYFLSNLATSFWNNFYTHLKPGLVLPKVTQSITYDLS